ncbi:MAG: sulfurtransferase-like selenium metabolism protein YedF [Chloroflexota bacterium]
MMVETVDARGLPCPQPVIKTRQAMEASAEVVTLVDNETAERNVTRMAEKAGARVTVEKGEEGLRLHISGGAGTAEAAEEERVPAPSGGPLVLVVPSEFVGRGEHDELGHILMRGFFHTLGEVEPVPDTIVFLNSGVKLVVEGSPVVADLRALAAEGVQILACGTCLGYYELEDAVAVGEISNMYTIAETMLRAGKKIGL